MRKSKQARLEKGGWRVGTTQEFLGLSDEEVAFIELKLALSENLRLQRRRRKMSQAEVAEKVRSSQSRIAKMEAGDPSVSVDLLLRTLLAIGATHRELAKVISQAHGRKAA